LRYAANVANEPVDPESRGILLFLLTTGDAESVLACLDEERRAVCVGAWRTLHGVSEADQGRILAEWRAEAVNTLPRGLDRLHPSWLVAALADEPAHILRIVLSELPQALRTTVLGLPGITSAGLLPAEEAEKCPLAMKREVVRVAFGWLSPLCESQGGPVAESLCALAFDELLTDVTLRGARAVGQSLAGSAPALRARAMAAAGEPWAQVIRKASVESTSDGERKLAMAHANTRIPDSARTPSDRLLHIGLVVLKSELATEHPGSVYRLAGRLPAALGRRMIGWEPQVFSFGSW
jgi:hypothetical protein